MSLDSSPARSGQERRITWCPCLQVAHLPVPQGRHSWCVCPARQRRMSWQGRPGRCGLCVPGDAEVLAMCVCSVSRVCCSSTGGEQLGLHWQEGWREKLNFFYPSSFLKRLRAGDSGSLSPAKWLLRG